MEKLTEKKALEICLELWIWLAETGRKYKTDWPGWEKYGHMSNTCPLCELRDQKRRKTCNQCPIYWRSEPGLANNCCEKDTPFWKWDRAETSSPRKEYTLQIVQLVKDALMKLNS